jgi:hypothetical protein
LALWTTGENLRAPELDAHEPISSAENLRKIEI